MALIYVDSFDTYQTADITKRWTAISASPEITATGRLGNGCEMSGTEYIKRAVPAASTYVVGFGLKCNPFPTSNDTLIGFYGTSYGQCYVNVTPLGGFTVTRPTANNDQTGNTQTGTVIGTSAAGCLAEAIWAYVEVWCKLDNTVGEVEIRVNGVPVLETADLTSRDTSWSETSIQAIAIGALGVTYIDDLYILDTTGSVNNTFLGDVTVEALFPQTDAVAAGTHEDFTCSTGTDQGAMVDESATDFPDEDTTYIYSSTVGHQSTFNYPALTPVSATICAVQVNICAKKSTTGTRTYKSLAKLAAGAATEGATTYAPSDTSYAYGCDVWEAKPGGGAWSVSDVNSAEFGVTVEA